MYKSDLTAEELRELQQSSNDLKHIRREPCRGYDYDDDDDDDFLNDYEY